MGENKPLSKPRSVWCLNQSLGTVRPGKKCPAAETLRRTHQHTPSSAVVTWHVFNYHAAPTVTEGRRWLIRLRKITTSSLHRPPQSCDGAFNWKFLAFSAHLLRLCRKFIGCPIYKFKHLFFQANQTEKCHRFLTRMKWFKPGKSTKCQQHWFNL